MGRRDTTGASRNAVPELRSVIPSAGPWLIPAVACSVAPLAGALLELIADVFDTTEQVFFATCAQIAPVFALALFVEIALVMTAVFREQGATDANTRTLKTLVRSNIALLGVSEGAALYATGAKASSSFLVACVVVPWGLQALLLIDTSYSRVGGSRIRSG
jgi:hypothetical protein